MIRRLKKKIYMKIETSPLLLNLYRFLSKIKSELFMIIPTKIYVPWLYRMKTGSSIDLKSPITFTDKVNFMKVNYHNPQLTTAADKYEVRNYVKSKGLEQLLVPIVGVYNSFEEIDFESITSPVYVKTTHGSGTNFRYDPKMTDSQTLEHQKKVFHRALKENYYIYSREWAYKNIRPRIIVEKSIAEDTGEDFREYKIQCINGEVEVVMVYEQMVYDSGEKKSIYEKITVDQNYELLPYVMGEDNKVSNNSRILKKPKQWDLIIELSQTLSEDFPLVRVDLMSTLNSVYFSELTFYFGGGNFTITPSKYDRLLGEKISTDKLTFPK